MISAPDSPALSARAISPIPLLVAGLFALAACVAPETTSEAPAKTTAANAAAEKVPQEVLQYGLDLAMAITVMAQCRKGLSLNVPYAEGMGAAFEKKYGKNPAWGEVDGAKQLGDKYIQDRFLEYVALRNVVMSQPQTWCAAGRADIAAGTRIGKLLIAQ